MALEERLLALARETDVDRPPRVREPHQEHRELGGACDVLLAHAVDRLSRNQNHIGVLLDEAEEAGVRLDFVTEEFEQTLVGQFILAARAFVAATEREKIVERTVRGKLERARSGRLPQGTGKGCYGYMYVPGTGHRLLDPEQAPIFVRIFEEFVAGKSCNRIANDLNADDIPTLTGRHRHPITVRRAIDNGTYTGRTIYRKTRVEMIRRPGERQRSRRVVERDESEHIEIPGASPPIVSRGLFNKAQEIRGQRARKAPSRNYPLGGRIRCLHCGAGMVGCTSNNGRYTYYRCNRVYLSKKDERCKSRQVRTDALEPAVREKLSELLADPAMVVAMAEALRLDTGNGRRLDEIERELGKLRDSERRLVDLYTDGQMEKTLLDEKSAELSEPGAFGPRFDSWSAAASCCRRHEPRRCMKRLCMLYETSQPRSASGSWTRVSYRSRLPRQNPRCAAPRVDRWRSARGGGGARAAATSRVRSARHPSDYSEGTPKTTTLSAWPRDHGRAARLGKGLAALPGAAIELDGPGTNVAFFGPTTRWTGSSSASTSPQRVHEPARAWAPTRPGRRIGRCRCARRPQGSRTPRRGRAGR